MGPIAVVCMSLVLRGSQRRKSSSSRVHAYRPVILITCKPFDHWFSFRGLFLFHSTRDPTLARTHYAARALLNQESPASAICMEPIISRFSVNRGTDP